VSAPLTRRAALTALGLAALGLARPVRGAQRRAARAVAAAARDWRTSPFNRRSPWNHPLGSAAQYAPAPQVSTVPISINYDERWTTAVALPAPGDPPATFLFSPNWGRNST